MRILSWIALAAFSVTSIAVAQSSPQATPGDAAGARLPAPAFIANTPDPAVGAVVSAVMPGVFGVGTVKGLPFSAAKTVVREQTLADGTVIGSTVEMLLYRDSEGRMRAESKLKPGSGNAQQAHIVTIWNPVDGTAISWVSGSQPANFASVIHLPESQLNGLMGSPALPRSARAPSPAQLSASTGEAANIRTDTLPPDTMAGLEVTGTRTTQVIPAGTVDNDREFTVVSETWTSPELKIVLRQMTSDPRTGRVTAELSNIDRSEPDPSLFKLPEGTRTMDIPLPPPAGAQR